jgi:E-phenylitaconyl-CoA hydratase
VGGACPRRSTPNAGRCRPDGEAGGSFGTRHGVRPGQTDGVGDSATYQLDGHVATITYNRPDALNAINADMRRDLNDAFARFRDDEAAFVAIVTGAGRAFCAGADLRQGGGSVGEFPGTFWEKPTLNSFESGWEIFKPVIAAVNGYCLGYGLTLATWCDFVLASDRAEFGLPEVQLGVPAMVASIRLPQRINWADAMELLLTGERIDAERAQAMGLVWRVVPHDRLLDEAHALARRLEGGAPLAQRAMKEMAMRTRHMPTLEAIRFGETMRQVALGTQDAGEGMRAAADGRPPRWTGR